MLTESTLLKHVALLGSLYLLSLAGLVACSTKEAPVPTPPKRLVRFSTTDSQGLVPEYKIVILEDSSRYADLNTVLGTIPDNETRTFDLANLTNRPSYYVRVTLAWHNIKKGGMVSAGLTSRVKAEWLVDNQVKKTMTLTPVNGVFGIFQACMLCDTDERLLLNDGFTVDQ